MTNTRVKENVVVCWTLKISSNYCMIRCITVQKFIYPSKKRLFSYHKADLYTNSNRLFS